MFKELEEVLQQQIQQQVQRDQGQRQAQQVTGQADCLPPQVRKLLDTYVSFMEFLGDDEDMASKIREKVKRKLLEMRDRLPPEIAALIDILR